MCCEAASGRTCEHDSMGELVIINSSHGKQGTETLVNGLNGCTCSSPTPECMAYTLRPMVCSIFACVSLIR